MSDGVFSIVITLLVFDLKLPSGIASDQLAASLVKLGPQFVSYVITFFLIGLYWVGHHGIMRHVQRYDRRFLWLNIRFLMCVSFSPFPTSLMGAFPENQISIALYGFTLIATGTSLATLWDHATNDRRLVDPGLSEEIIIAARKRILSAPIVATVSIFLSFIDPRLSIALYFLGALSYVLPARLDRIIQDESRVDKRQAENPAE